MRQNYTKDRRRFLKESLSYCTGAYSLNFLSNTRDDPYRDKYYPEVLTQVMKEQEAKHDCTMLPGQINNLTYAFKQIKPACHQDMAFVVACSMSFYSMKHVIDEYSRRKNGEQSKAPDHPVLALEKWGVPNTYRILIFKEQIHALFRELIVNTPPNIIRLWYDILNKTINCEDFYELLTEKYRNQLSKDEVKIICEALLYVTRGGCRPYTWCSAMASRADALVKSTYLL